MSRSAQPFGRYELLERISAGGMAEVFRALDTKTDHVVALKRILPQIAEDEEFVQMFEDEARIASQLEHPHIARTLDFGHIDESYYIAFEYVNGRDLRALFDRCVRLGEFPPLSFLLYVFARIGEGLAYAHARKDANGEPQSIVHRDISPQNIIVSFDGDVKLIDFGIAKAAGKLSRTQVGTLKGKFGYMAPEQIKGTEIDHRADLFSLGICMWELLTLERLFNAENELLVLEKVRSATIAPPSIKNRDVPPELDRIVLKALAKDVRERYGAAKDVFRDLDKLAKAIDAAAAREDVARYMRRAFPESLARRPTPSDVGPVTSNARAKQESTMAADIPSSDKRGSDLDIFEGLGKKSGTSAPASRAPSAPPPPPPSRSVSNPPMVIKNDLAKKTLVGIAPAGLPAATAQPTQGGPQRILTPQPRSAPPPPPGRGSLPQVVPPPPRASVMPPAPVPPQTMPGMPGLAATAAATSSAPTRASAAPPAGAAGAKAKLDMDWDDEDEATHVFDKPLQGDAEESPTDRPPRPAAGTPMAPPVNTLTGGIGAPSVPPPPVSRRSGPMPPPPSSRQSAPPPPPSLNAFARQSAAPPPPPTFPTPSSEPGTFPKPSQPPMMMAPQVNTAPMPMPGRTNGVQGGFLPPGPALPPVTGAPTLGSRMEATQLVRPKETGKAGMIGAAIAIFAVAAGLVVFLMMPRTGRIAVNVADVKGTSVNRVEIFVDGKKQCETAPCIVDQVSTGTHEVKVIAQGYDTPSDRSVTVDARKDTSLDFSLTGASSQAGTGIKVGGSQPGVKLYVDAQEIGPLPQEIHTLKPGTHAIRLAGTDRYTPLEKSVSLGDGEMQDLGDQTLKVLKGKATITLGTPGAKVSIVSGNDRREFPTLPIAVDLDTSKSWALEAAKPGYSDYHQAVSFDDGVAEKTFNITLDPKSAAAAVAAAPAAAPAAPRFIAAAAPKPPPAPKDTSKDTSDDNAPTASAGGGGGGGGGGGCGEGFLNINSLPPSSVTLDGRPLGQTPKVHVSVSAGSHTVVFTNSDQGLKKELKVSVAAGETKPAVARLRAE